MYRFKRTKRFEKAYQRLKESGKFKIKAQRNPIEVINMIAGEKLLPTKYVDHALASEYLGYRECHTKGDVLLLYQLDADADILHLVDIGSRAGLFE